MPYLKLQTNQTLTGEEKIGLCKITSECIAESLNKSEKYVMVTIQSDQIMTFAGTNEACAYIELKSIELPRDRVSELSTKLCNMIQRNVGAAPERIYIEFTDSSRDMWGWDGKTF